jgi:hypothetical protein
MRLKLVIEHFVRILCETHRENEIFGNTRKNPECDVNSGSVGDTNTHGVNSQYCVREFRFKLCFYYS